MTDSSVARDRIADTLRAKLTVLPSGFTAEPVARGEAEIAVQQVSELMVVPGVEIVEFEGHGVAPRKRLRET